MKLYRLTSLFLFAASALACDGEAIDSDETYAEDQSASETAGNSNEANGSDSDSQLDEDSPEEGQSGDAGDDAQDQNDDQDGSKDSNVESDEESEEQGDDATVEADDSDSVVCQAIGCEKEELCGGDNKPEGDCKPGYECINQVWSCIDDGKVCPKPGSQKEVFEGPVEACAQVITYVTHPKTGLCCEYSDTCSAPENWDSSKTECK